jgi:hypothetical protein
MLLISETDRMETISENRNTTMVADYYSAEFKLRDPRLFYKFKIRNSVLEPLFAVIKEGSHVLKNIKQGDVINMRYYPSDNSIPAQTKETKIKYITMDSPMAFKNHYVIGLDVDC